MSLLALTIFQMMLGSSALNVSGDGSAAKTHFRLWPETVVMDCPSIKLAR